MDTKRGEKGTPAVEVPDVETEAVSVVEPKVLGRKTSPRRLARLKQKTFMVLDTSGAIVWIGNGFDPIEAAMNYIIEERKLALSEASKIDLISEWEKMLLSGYDMKEIPKPKFN